MSRYGNAAIIMITFIEPVALEILDRRVRIEHRIVISTLEAGLLRDGFSKDPTIKRKAGSL